MGFETIQALSGLKARRGNAGWDDWRSRSPKALNDFSGIVTPRVGASSVAGVQDFDYELPAKLNICNDLVWTCIELISSTAALGKMKVRKRVGSTLTYLPDHPLQKLLDTPNSTMTQFDFIQAYCVHQRLFGTVAILIAREDMVAVCPVCAGEGLMTCIHRFFYYSEGKVAQMMPVHPSKLEEDWYVTPDGKRQRLFFYVPEPGVKMPIHPNNMLSDPFYNTEIGFYGVSPTVLLKRWLDLDASMTNQIKDLFDNGGIPSMVISLKPNNNISYEQEPATLIQMMKEKWHEQFASGGKSRKAPAFVYGDVTVDRIQDKPEEGISKALYYEITGRVCAAYGVPPTLYEIGMKYGSQRASAEQAEKDFYNRTISKIFKRLELKINNIIVPSYNEPGLEVGWDLSEVGIAAFLAEQKKTSIKRDWELGLITRDEGRLGLGYTALGGELGDDLYRISVMSDGSNGAQVSGQDNRLQTAQDTSLSKT